MEIPPSPHVVPSWTSSPERGTSQPNTKGLQYKHTGWHTQTEVDGGNEQEIDKQR